PVNFSVVAAGVAPSASSLLPSSTSGTVMPPMSESSDANALGFNNMGVPCTVVSTTTCNGLTNSGTKQTSYVVYLTNGLSRYACVVVLPSGKAKSYVYTGGSYQ